MIFRGNVNNKGSDEKGLLKKTLYSDVNMYIMYTVVNPLYALNLTKCQSEFCQTLMVAKDAFLSRDVKVGEKRKKLVKPCLRSLL